MEKQNKYFLLNLSIETPGISEEKMGEFMEDIISVVENHGFTAGGGIKPVNEDGMGIDSEDMSVENEDSTTTDVDTMSDQHLKTMLNITYVQGVCDCANIPKEKLLDEMGNVIDKSRKFINQMVEKRETFKPYKECTK